jgi:hypothetical protein
MQRFQRSYARVQTVRMNFTSISDGETRESCGQYFLLGSFMSFVFHMTLAIVARLTFFLTGDSLASGRKLSLLELNRSELTSQCSSLSPDVVRA